MGRDATKFQRSGIIQFFMLNLFLVKNAKKNLRRITTKANLVIQLPQGRGHRKKDQR